MKALRFDDLWARLTLRSSTAAQRFQALLDAPADASAVLRVCSGVHAGASATVGPAGAWIGADAACDIVLQDAHLLPRHARVAWQGQRFELLDAASGALISPRAQRIKDGQCVDSHLLNTLELALCQAAPPPAAPAAARPAPRVTAARVLWASLAGVALVASAGPWAVASLAPTPTERLARAQVALAQRLPAGVRLRAAADGVLEAEGLVADEAARRALVQVLATQGFGDIRLRVRSAAALCDELRQALGDDTLKFSLDAQGRVRVDGTTEQMAVKNRLRALAAELPAGSLDDRVVLVDARAPAAPLPLPLRITDVMGGEQPYFRTDAGARYYVGARLPDGAEVLSISTEAVVFRRDDKTVLYRLQ